MPINIHIHTYIHGVTLSADLKYLTYIQFHTSCETQGYLARYWQSGTFTWSLKDILLHWIQMGRHQNFIFGSAQIFSNSTTWPLHDS